MATIKQLDAMQKLIETVARMTTPYDNMHREATDDDREAIAADLDDNELCSDAQALYRVIEEAREILKGKRK